MQNPFETTAASRPGQSEWASVPSERRKASRLKVPLNGRFMRANKEEAPCQLIDISTEGAALTSTVQVEVGEWIIAYIDTIGGVEGDVTRTYIDGFALELVATPRRREKLAAHIALLHGEPGVEQPRSIRRHERWLAGPANTPMSFDDGETTEVRVLDVSISGASVATKYRPQIGSEVKLGQLRARVVRYHASGLGLQFLDVQQPEAVRRYFG